MLPTFRSYPKGGTFTTKLDLKNYSLINHKTVFGTRNRAFWVGAVTCWASSVVVALSVHSCCVLARLLVSSFYFLIWLGVFGKNEMCLQMRWLFLVDKIFSQNICYSAPVKFNSPSFYEITLTAFPVF